MVKYVYAYVTYQRNERISYQTDVYKEVEFYKKNQPDKKPVVLFDFHASIDLIRPSEQEVLCAGRYGECIRRAKRIFENFRKLNIDMVFFLEGTVKEDKYPEWIRRRNTQYESDEKIFAMLKKNEPINGQRFNKHMNNYFWNYLQVAKEYGKIFVSLDNECDLDLAQYALKTKPMAIFASDTDFLIMPGSCNIWVLHGFDVETMKLTVWNKSRFRQSLQLQQWQMPILSALCGNGWIEPELVEHLRHSLRRYGGRGSSSNQYLKQLASFIQSEFHSPDGINKKLTGIIYNDGQSACKKTYAEVEKLVKINMDFYNCESNAKCKIPEWLRNHINETASTAILKIYDRRTLAIPQPYIDASIGTVPFADLVIPIFRRQMGIVCGNQREAYADSMHRICFKPSAKEPFTISEYTPIFPTFNVPELADLVSSNVAVTIEQKLEMYAWLTSVNGVQTKVENLQLILETTFIVPAVVVDYLVKYGQITKDEADILLISIFEALHMNPEQLHDIKPPTGIAERAFWISFVFTNMFWIFEEAMTICGLFKFIPRLHYDGYIFHRMYLKYPQLPLDERKEKIELIKDFRLYSK